MGPLVPDFIGEEFNLIAALIIGIAFGYILEQAGFSSSKRLAGVFYGYDFTVLRVFFTAGVTAVVGIILLEQFSLIDADFIFINPTWLYPAIAGGVVMGFGFILGGYCPGTSICAAAIGKKDAMIFVLGALAGVFLFAELFPYLAEFYDSSYLGAVKVYESLSISRGLFIIILIPVAVAAFYFTTKIEKKVSRDADGHSFKSGRHFGFAAVLIAITLVLALLPEKREQLMEEAKTLAADPASAYPVMDSDELAFRILEEDHTMHVFHITTEDSKDTMMLPGSEQIGLNMIAAKEGSVLLGSTFAKKILVAEDENTEKVAYQLASLMGFNNLYILKGGMAEFRNSIFARENIELVRQSDVVLADFRADACTRIEKMILAAQSGPVKTASVKKVKGGC
ncbi:MAG: YeeE/YedE family protein [Ignavibacteriales bacterium]|nr:MAG: YeeE/YedE family protein [Ignavibacteriales bacterium]